MNRPATRDPDWVGLADASRILGVSPATIRRWSDVGRLRVFTTPGGHRRFSREGLERLLPADRSRRPTIGAAVLNAARIARAYRRSARENAPGLPWILALPDDQRLLLRERGQVLTASLVQYLDAPAPESAAHHLSEATTSAADYGRVAVDLGLSLSQTVEVFLRFRAPFRHELAVAARRRGFDAAETSDLLENAELAMDELLIATMAGHGDASRRGARRRRP
jgi:excisionase family DNA binding protein